MINRLIADESETELPVPVKKLAAQPAAKKPAAQAAAKKQESEDEEDDEDDDEEDDDSEDEPMDTTPAKGKKAHLAKAAAVKAGAEEFEDEEEDDEEDEEEEETVQETPGKRKKEMAKQKGTPDAKKKKTEETAFSLFMGNLNSNKDFEELKTAIRDFIAKKDLQVHEIRTGNSKCCLFDMATKKKLRKMEEETMNLKLNGLRLSRLLKT